MRNIEELKNFKVIEELTKNGSNIRDWKKYRTKSITVGNNNVSLHFYRNELTGELNFTIDYKINIDKSKIRK